MLNRQFAQYTFCKYAHTTARIRIIAIPWDQR